MSFLSFYIVDRKTGISYDPYHNLGKVLLADSSAAIGSGTVFNISKLTKALAEKRYRLVLKSGNN